LKKYYTLVNHHSHISQSSIDEVAVQKCINY